MSGPIEPIEGLRPHGLPSDFAIGWPTVRNDVARAWVGDTEWNPTFDFLWKGLNVAVMSASVASALVSIARIGRIVREAIADAAAAEFDAEIRKLRQDVESHAQDLETRMAELLRRANRLERKLEEMLKAREAQKEAAESPAAAIRASLERKSAEIAEAVAGFRRRVRDILEDKWEGADDDGRRG